MGLLILVLVFHPFKVERQIPSVFTHTLWNKIFDEVDIQIDSVNDLFTTSNDFLTEVVTPPIGYAVEDVNQSELTIGSYNTTTVSRQEVDDVETSYSNILGFNTQFTDSRISFGTGGVITINDDLSVRVNLEINYTNAYSGSDVKLRVFLGGSVIKSYSLPSNGGAPSQLNEVLNITANAGDTLIFQILGSGQYNSTNPGFWEVQYSASAAIDFTELSGGFLVDFSTMMGDTTQLDFIKDVMQRYGLVLKPNEGNVNSYSFIQFEELLNDKVGAEDWSDKLVGISKESYGIKYAKQNKAKYKYDSEIKLPTQDGEIIIDNENAEPEKTLFTSVFEIPSTYEIYKGEPLYLHPVWEDKDGLIDIKETKLRTFRIKPTSGTISAYYFADTISTTFTGNIPMLSLDTMSMQHYLSTYYKAYRFLIGTYKEIDADLNLSNIDIHRLDFFKLKYLKQTGKYYYLNNVKHSAGGEVSKAELIEINQFGGNEPPVLGGSFTMSINYGQSINTIHNCFYNITNTTIY